MLTNAQLQAMQETLLEEQLLEEYQAEMAVWELVYRLSANNEDDDPDPIGELLFAA